ncbi:hypothetical protein ADIS_0452 [Lunatimonas lonarensis]|uniref:Uncharacterized protein n=1 Tax=Lunatimonas lonarensis TaxID=1232681 RepID=R7ZY11_9BACT|nr:hypothetical protein [Lunatimonas lonarensis]EON79035.1 hypothetical protein ADIS_0452 [Lunatimonas lonarensis]
MQRAFIRQIRKGSLLLWFIFTYAALTAQENVQKLQLADSIAKQTLEKEGLFTVMGGLKPISTVEHIQFSIDSLSKEYLNPAQVAQQIRMLKESLMELTDDNIGFAIVPFKAVYGSGRSFQLLVFNRASIQKAIAKYPDFFIKRGVLADAEIDPSPLLIMYEFEEKMDRFRAYGYLFGYPAYAVDFFVDAALHQEETGEFVKRGFFQIPVASSDTGRFVYAIPENQEPQPVDLEIERRAREILETYKRIRDERPDALTDYPFLQLFKFVRESFGNCNCLN